eukprot:TRINITY_DN2028_c0_g1_i1.p1 TRINITY_DN2028_c0_g1~~TRINITY_DN2028_c0_g1_i1.p1  ORF type:complete len:197 (-),score=50.19 TRINITY_DN2028_c0_g1_i1:559-1149(-)
MAGKVEREIAQYLADGNIGGLAETLENLELNCQAASAAFPYTALLLASYLVLDDLNNARFLWKRSDATVKKDKEVAALWEIGKSLWKRETGKVLASVNAFQWSNETNQLVRRLEAIMRARVLAFIPAAYTNISVADVAQYLGVSADVAAQISTQEGWAVDKATNLVTPTRPTDTKVRRTGLAQLQQLTQYAVALEN